MKNLLVITFLAAHLFVSARAQISIEGQPTPVKAPTPTPAPTGVVPKSDQSGVQSTAYQTLEQSSRDTMANSQKGQSGAQALQMGFAVIGAAFAANCGSQNYSACVMSAISFLKSNQSGQSANSFNGPIQNAWDNACTFSTFGCSSTPENPYTAALTPGVINKAKLDADNKKTKEALTKAGYEVDMDSGKIKTPKGELNANDSEALKAALGDENYNAMLAQEKNLEKDIMAKLNAIKAGGITAALGFDGGGRATASLSEAGYEGSDDPASGGVSAGSGLKAMRKPGQATGLTKNFNGDPIGVAADSIFEMMARRYQLKTSQKTFYGPDLQ